jgi:hypothetical protein
VIASISGGSSEKAGWGRRRPETSERGKGGLSRRRLLLGTGVSEPGVLVLVIWGGPGLRDGQAMAVNGDEQFRVVDVAVLELCAGPVIPGVIRVS